MTFRRFLAILLLFLLPLQSTLALADSCCLSAGAASTVTASHGGGEDGSGASAGYDSCSSCDFCHHGSTSLACWVGSSLIAAVAPAPTAHPDVSFDSFISDVPPRPDRRV